METKTLTPVQLWQDFNNYSTPINMSIVGYNIVDDIAITEYFFTAFSVADGDVRVYAKTFCRPKSENNPVIFYVDEFYVDFEFEYARPYIKLGYTVVTFDFKGKDANQNLYTKYPASLNYGNIASSGDHLLTAKHGAQNSSLFLWSKITRRVISFIEELPTCDASRIVGASTNTGANILWQVAGTDTRLRAMITFYNTGFSDFNGNLPSKKNLDIDAEAERNRWVIGLAVPSYAKFVTCPVIFVGTSNSRDYDYISLSNTLSMLPNDTYHAEIITIGTDKNLDARAHPALISMIDNAVNDRENSRPPAVVMSVDNSSIFFDITADIRFSSILKVEFHVSYGDIPSAIRNWKTQNVSMGMDGIGRIAVKVYDLNERIYTTATIIYTDGFIISAPLTSFVPADLDTDIVKNIKNNRIIFERKLGTRAFFIRNKELFIDPDRIALASGPLDILGVSSDYNELICYNIGDILNKGVDNTLQFDCYSELLRTFTLKLTDRDLVEYSMPLTVGGTDEWIKMTLDAQEFKDINLMTLRSWKDIKAISFVDAEGIIFNNIIWI